MIVRQEPLAQATGELQALIALQHDHTGDAELPPNPNWAVYSQLETMGKAALFMVRDNDRAIGYAAVLLHPALNAQDIWMGTIPTYFVEEHPIRGLILRELWRTGIQWLQDRGARKVDIETEYQHSAGQILERMGFIPVKIGYRMPLLSDAVRATQ